MLSKIRTNFNLDYCYTLLINDCTFGAFERYSSSRLYPKCWYTNTILIVFFFVLVALTTTTGAIDTH